MLPVCLEYARLRRLNAFEPFIAHADKAALLRRVSGVVQSSSTGTILAGPPPTQPAVLASWLVFVEAPSSWRWLWWVACIDRPAPSSALGGMVLLASKTKRFVMFPPHAKPCKGYKASRSVFWVTPGIP